MTIREKVFEIMRICGVPIEPNSYTDGIVHRIRKVIDKRYKK